MKTRDYNEHQALREYLWFEQGLLTDLEIRAERTLIIRKKAVRASKATYDRYAKLLLEAENDEVVAVLKDGEDGFWQNVCDRILAAEKREEVRLNRCPQCERLVRTEAAKQCLWCGHDWH